MRKRFLLVSSATLFSFSLTYAFGNYTWNPYRGRVSFSGTATKEVIYNTDGMLPLYGNQKGFLYADAMGDIATDDTFLISPGSGYRQIINNQILGFYFFGDYQRTDESQNFWDLSPGIEWMSPHWDAHINAYFPTQKSKQSGATVFASTLGNNNNVSFQEGTHNQYDELETPYAFIGNGVDGEIGYSFSNYKHLRSRIYLGSYHYQPPSAVESFTGVTLGYEKSLSNNISVAVRNSYDKVSDYTIGISLILSFGGKQNNFSTDVKDRLLEPLQRHIGIIGTGAGTYAQQAYQSDGRALQYDNVYFISTNGAGDGTYGNPAPLTQATLDSINNSAPNNARLYLQGESTYTISGSYLTPYNGQDFYGRTYDYTAPAIGNDRPILFQPTLVGANAVFLLGDHGNSTNIFSDLQFTGNYTPGAGGAGIYALNNETNVVINNSVFSHFDSGALYFPNTQANVDVRDSTFKNNSRAIFFDPGEGSLNIEHSLVTLDNNFAVGTGTNPIGIEVLNTSTNTLNFTANNLQILFNGNPVAAQGLVLQNQTSGELNAYLNYLTLTGAANGLANNGFEIYNGIGAANAGKVNVTVENSLFKDNGNTGGYGNIYINANNGGVTNFNFLNSVSSNGSSYGLLVYNNNLNDTVNVNIKNSVFNNSGVNIAGLPFGNIALWSQGQGTINFSATDSTISNTTDSVPALWVSNDAGAGSNINVQSLSGTSFLNNTGGGIYAYAKTGTSTTINYSGAIFDNSTPHTATDPASTGTIIWIP